MTASDELPVNRRDLVALVVVSALGGFAIAAWVATPEPTPQFAVGVLSGTTMLLFFLFVPVMGLRLFLDERAGEK